MHYQSNAFAINPRYPTIRALYPEYQQTMGQGRGPSFLDILQMNRHYGCIGNEFLLLGFSQIQYYLGFIQYSIS